MNDKQIEILKEAISRGIVQWNPDSRNARQVVKVSKHVEEGEGLCGIFANGEYVALYNCDLSDFVLVTRFTV